MNDKCIYCRKKENLIQHKDYDKVKYHKKCDEEFKQRSKNMWDEYDKITSRS